MTEAGTEDRDDIRPLAGPPPAEEPPPLFRDTIESFVLAVIIALVVKSFLAEAYKVPTGSMEPTIHGSPIDGDRILVNKLAAVVREPRRWETWVFQYPNNRRVNYVKRFVGIGPETLRIAAGDIWTSPLGTADDSVSDLWESGELAVERKPDALRDATFERYPQVHPDAVELGDPELFAEFWFTPATEVADDSSFEFAADGLRMNSASRTWAHFRNAIKDRLDPWAPVSPTNHEGIHDVGDLRIDVTVEPAAAGGRVVLQIRDSELSEFIEARIAIGSAGGTSGIWLGDDLLDDLEGLRLEAGRPAAISFASADDRITLAIDGELVGRADFRHEPMATTGVMRWPARVSFGVEAGAALFRRAQVYRDIYYRGGGGRGRSVFDPSYESCCVDIPAGHYFVLGDNSPASNDSREWRRKTIRWISDEVGPLSGDMMAITDPDRLDERQDNPYTEIVGDRSRRIFVDEFGNRHAIDDYGPIREARDLPSPLVPRSLLVGRAFAIFLPIDRMRLVR